MRAIQPVKLGLIGKTMLKGRTESDCEWDLWSKQTRTRQWEERETKTCCAE